MSKKDKILQKIKNHCNNKLYTRIKRGIKNDFEEISRGYILKYSDEFILIKEESDFIFCGYHIFPISSILGIRYNDNDKYYDFINKSIHPEKEFVLDSKIDLDITSWESIFKDLKEKNEAIITECEKYKHQLFCIGLIQKFNQKEVYIEYFNAQGYLDQEFVKHKYKWITKITFKDNYSRVFSKYTRKRTKN